MSSDVSVSREINAPAEHVYGMVSDLARMGEWSPENAGGMDPRLYGPRAWRSLHRTQRERQEEVEVQGDDR